LVLFGVVMMVGCSECSTCPQMSNGETKTICPSVCPANGGVCPADGATEEAPKDIIQVAQGAEQFSTLIKALDAANMTDVLKGVGPFTVFAPTNEAFDKLPEGVLDSLLKPECKSDLRQLLNYHVVSGKVRACDIQRITKCDTMSGEAFRVSRQNGNILVDNAKVTQADIEACNGVIHAIDQVLIPCDLQKRIRQLSQKREQAQKDQGAEQEITRGQLQNIVETAQGMEELSTFVKALKAADLADTLEGSGSFTIFAPTNEAWDKLPEGQMKDLFLPENKAQLQRILKMHVIKGDKLSQDQISSQKSLGPLGERMLTVNVRDKFVTIDEDQASIIKADIQADNGVIHEIDTIILP
jgi:uncharacterized surface protein with fasciclin (FAS1) repeats